MSGKLTDGGEINNGGTVCRFLKEFCVTELVNLANAGGSRRPVVGFLESYGFHFYHIYFKKSDIV